MVTWQLLHILCHYPLSFIYWKYSKIVDKKIKALFIYAKIQKNNQKENHALKIYFYQ